VPPVREAATDRLLRFVGGLYLLQMATGVFAQLYARGSLVVPGDPSATAVGIRAAQPLFRIGIVADVVCYLAVLLAVWALYVVLRPVQRDLATLALLLRGIELSLHLGAVVLSLAALRLLAGGPSLAAIPSDQREAFAYFAIGVQGIAVGFGFLLLGLGSGVFAYLLGRARYVPRAWAMLGVIASAMLAVHALGASVAPALRQWGYVPMLPMGVYEVGLGFYLLARGAGSTPTLSSRHD
jgi:hypothetical protein